MSRTLLIVPIVHSEADLGGLAGAMREQLGESAWRDKQQAVNAFWARVDDWASGLQPGQAPLQLYQDGLPNDEHADRIVAELASKGSENHRILSELMHRGGNLVGTEDPQLLIREYELARGALEAVEQGRRPDPRDAQRSATILARRDQAIARRIDETLPDPGVGVLFIGMLHAVEGSLADDITVEYPLGQPSRGRQAG